MSDARRTSTGLAEREFAEPSARRALAAALGHALAGGRACVRVGGAALPPAIDLLAEMARRRAPVVLSADCRDGHAAYHLAADTGAVLLFARDAGEAEVLALLARRVAETALLPVLVAIDAVGASAQAIANGVARRYVGATSDQIATPTLAQELLFGGHRRRLPRWFDVHRPALLGADLEPDVRALAEAGSDLFVYSAVTALVESAFAALREASLPPLGTLSEHSVADADLIIVAQGEAVVIAETVAAQLRAARGPRVGVIGVRCLRPLPSSRLLELLRGRRAVLVLERVGATLAGDGPLTREVRVACDRALDVARATKRARSNAAGWRDKDRPRLHTAIFGLGGAPLVAADLALACRRLQDDAPALIHLGVDFAPLAEALPKRRVLLESLGRAWPGLAGLGMRARAAGTPLAPAAAVEPPLRLRADAGSSEALADLARFWDQTGVPYATAGAAALSPEPCLGTGVVPAQTAALRDLGPDRATLPVFAPDKCTGCGACWTACPDGAIAATALLPAAMIDAGIAASGAEPLRMLAGRLAARLGAALAEPVPPPTLARALQPAWPDIVARGKPSDERRAALDAAFAAFVGAVGDLPVAQPDAFAVAENQGELLALAVDPAACKACGLCVAVCEPGALTAAPRDVAGVAAARTQWHILERLPEPSDATGARLRQQPVPGRAAMAALWRRNARLLGRGDAAEPGAGDKIALRVFLTAVEAHARPRRARLLQQIAELRGKLGDSIRSLLARALPVEDLEALSEGVALLGRGDVELSAFARRMDEVCSSGHVDTRRLGEVVELARGLADLHWRLGGSDGGSGRASVGLTVTTGAAAAWARSFPWNALAAPVIAADATTALDLALGLADGQLGAALADVRLLRRARSHLVGPAELAKVAGTLDGLTADDLTDDEWSLCPLTVVVGDAAGLSEVAAGSLGAVLASRLPIAILALADADPRTASTRAELALLAALSRSGYVAQCSIGAPDHLHDAVTAVLRRGGAGLLHVHAPSPRRDGFATDAAVAQARRALAARVLPLFRFDPSGPGAFGTRLDLGPSPRVGDQALAFATWAAPEARFAAWFTPLAADAPAPLPLAEYLALAAAARPGHTPFLDGPAGRRAVAEDLLACAAERRRGFELLQELAGVRSPFTARLREEIAEATSAQHAAELAAREQDFATRLQEARNEVTAEMLSRLHERLVALSLRGTQSLQGNLSLRGTST